MKHIPVPSVGTAQGGSRLLHHAAHSPPTFNCVFCIELGDSRLMNVIGQCESPTQPPPLFLPTIYICQFLPLRSLPFLIPRDDHIGNFLLCFLITDLGPGTAFHST